jgi:hypothetical protein
VRGGPQCSLRQLLHVGGGLTKLACQIALGLGNPNEQTLTYRIMNDSERNPKGSTPRPRETPTNHSLAYVKTICKISSKSSMNYEEIPSAEDFCVTCPFQAGHTPW